MAIQEAKALDTGDYASLSAHYNASQLRADTWNRLKAVTMGLANRPYGRDTPESLKDEAVRALDLLAPMETYWAFPGRDACHQLRKLLGREDYATLAGAVARIVRALMSNAYRRRTIPIGIQGEAEDEEEVALEAKDDHLLARPYFEVMFVDNLGAHARDAPRRGPLRL
jgi:arginine decarboxylase